MVWQGGAPVARRPRRDEPGAARRRSDLDAELRADIGASDGGTLVVVHGADMQAALRSTEAAGARLDALVDKGELAGFETVTRMLPSEAAQQARIASLPDAATLRTRLAEATRGLPLPAARLEPFIAEVAGRAGAADRSSAPTCAAGRSMRSSTR